MVIRDKESDKRKRKLLLDPMGPEVLIVLHPDCSIQTIRQKHNRNRKGS
jgi:hypothetical protein